MKSNKLIAQFIDILDEIQLETGENVPGLIMSSPGAGKTSTVEKFCELRDYNLTTLIASQYAPDDIIGLQSVVQDGENTRLRRLTPDWYDRMVEKASNGKRNILFIDEISTCDETIQAPLLNLIFSGDIGGKRKLPDNTLIVAAGNYSDNLNGAFQMTAPLVNRFLILNINSDDQNLEEMLSTDFSELKGERLEEFLGINSIKEPYWDCSKIDKEFFLKKVKLENKGSITNNSEEGLLGFASIRAIQYSRKFLFYFARKYNSDLWFRVVGDTIGKIYENGKDDKGFPAREYIISKKGDFVYFNGIKASDGKTLVESILDACSKGKREGYEQLRGYIDNPDSLTQEDINAIMVAGHEDKRISSICTQIQNAKINRCFV